jgi:hypothetical protein
MEAKQTLLFFSYARADAEFALKLAKSLRSAGANLWIDQLDIRARTLGTLILTVHYLFFVQPIHTG